MPYSLSHLSDSMALLYTLAGMVGLLLILYILVIISLFKIHKLKKRYNAVLAGTDGKSIEDLIKSNYDTTTRVLAENKAIRQDNQAIHGILEQTIQKIGAVRFAAFEDVGSDLSYALALLDAKDNGVILTSIFSRSTSNTYLKPVKNGVSPYHLSDEENQALQKAMHGN